MSSVVTVGARAFLDSNRTDDEFLGVCVGLFAELADGRRINIDPAAYTIHGPRRGVGALWGEISIDPLTLPRLDRELFARDPLEAATRALEASFSLQAEHLEEYVRNELSVGTAARLQADGREGASSTIDVQDDGLWANLVGALRDADVPTTPAALRVLPFRMEFDAALLTELAR
jgi:hypothetical protein